MNSNLKPTIKQLIVNRYIKSEDSRYNFIVPEITLTKIVTIWTNQIQHSPAFRL